MTKVTWQHWIMDRDLSKACLMSHHSFMGNHAECDKCHKLSGIPEVDLVTTVTESHDI